MSSTFIGSGVLKGLGGIGIKPGFLLGTDRNSSILKRAVEPDPCADDVPEKGHQPYSQGNGQVVYGADG